LLLFVDGIVEKIWDNMEEKRQVEVGSGDIERVTWPWAFIYTHKAHTDQNKSPLIFYVEKLSLANFWHVFRMRKFTLKR